MYWSGMYLVDLTIWVEAQDDDDAVEQIRGMVGDNDFQIRSIEADEPDMDNEIGFKK